MNRLLRCTSVWLMVACGVVVAQTRRVNAPQADNVPLALTHVAVIDATGSPAQLEMTVIISGGRITRLGPAAKVKVPADALVIDASKKFLIPGLWDMHIHVDDSELYPTHPSRADKEAVFPLLTANGVTGVRDMSGGLEQIQQWRTSIELGDLLGPRMFTPGLMVDGKFPVWLGVMRVESEVAAALAYTRDLKTQKEGHVDTATFLLPADQREGFRFRDSNRTWQPNLSQ